MPRPSRKTCDHPPADLLILDDNVLACDSCGTRWLINDAFLALQFRRLKDHYEARLEAWDAAFDAESGEFWDD